jgi:hypothetical protein
MPMTDETGGSMKQARPTQQDIEQLFYIGKRRSVAQG